MNTFSRKPLQLFSNFCQLWATSLPVYHGKLSLLWHSSITDNNHLECKSENLLNEIINVLVLNWVSCSPLLYHKYQSYTNFDNSKISAKKCIPAAINTQSQPMTYKDTVIQKNTKANITRNRDIFIIIFNVTNQIIIIIIIIIITILMVADGGPPMGTTADSLATAWITTYKPKWIWPKKIKQLETLNYKHMCLWPPKIPSELEVTPRYNCLHCWHCWHR